MKRIKRLLGMFLCCVMMLSLMPTTVLARDDGYGGQQSSKLNHIDVRVAGSLTLVSKVNGETISSEKVNVTVSNVSATLNGKSVSFYKKAGSGKENEWRADNLSLNKDSDVVVLTCSVSGTKSDGSKVNLNVSKTYQGATVLTKLINECPAKNGYDIDVNAEDLQESFTVNAYVEKEWVDNNNQYEKRPESIQVQMYADGEKYGKPVTLNESNSWSASYVDMPKYSSGTNEINYSVKEVSVPEGYTASVNGFTITNTYNAPVETSVDVSKEWYDDNNRDGIRPESVTVKLLENGEFTGKTLVLSEANDWAGTFTGLAKLNNDREMVYSVEESEVDNYTTCVTGNSEDGFIIKNTHEPEIIDVSGSKLWDDAGDQDGARPKSITVNLMADGDKVDSKVVTSADDWKWSFNNVYKYEDGQEIDYTFTEESVENYSVDYTKDNIIKNSYTPEKTSVSVTKAWNDDGDRDGIRPDSVTVKLLADGKNTGKTLVLNEANEWTGAFTELDMYKNHGTLIKYTVVEKDKYPGYKSSIVKAENGNIFTITNTHTPERISASGTKTWNDAGNQDGIRPDSITVRLMANGQKIDSKKVTEADDWSWTFDNLYKFENGKKIVYSVKEDPVEGYTCKVDGMNITNTHELEMTQITIGKTWVGDKASDRPDSIKVKVFADGMYLTTVDVTAQDNWAYTLTDLPKYKAGEIGKKIVYTISENEVPGYESSVNGFTITNTITSTNTDTNTDTDTNTNTNTNTNTCVSEEVPQTGDDFNAALYMFLMLLALIGISTVVIKRKKVK